VVLLQPGGYPGLKEGVFVDSLITEVRDLGLVGKPT
jgi:hypothetical protein